MEIFNNLESEVRSYCRSFPVVFSKAHGPWLLDSKGEKYLDFFAGAGALNYGHNDPDMVTAVQKYLENNGIVHTLDLHSEAKADFLDTFKSHILAPRRLDYKIQFTAPTGSDAIEAAIKLARKLTGRTTVACFSGGYHGMSLGALSLTANSSKRALAGLAIPGTLRLPYEGFLPLPSIDQLGMIETMLTKPGSGNDLPAAIVLECVQGEGGLNVATPFWAQGIAALARRIGALLIVDDIQAGCGRTGHFFSFEPLGITPDIVCLSKSLSGIGLPFSVNLIARDKDLWAPGDHIGTFRGNNLAMITATTAIRKYWANNSLTSEIFAKSDAACSLLKTELKDELKDKIDIVGRGFMLGLKFQSPDLARKASERLFKLRVIAETCGPDGEILKLMPPLTIDQTNFMEGIALIADVSRQLANAGISRKELCYAA